MLTSYLVSCPHFNCDWSGSLLPSSDTDSWQGAVPTTSTAVFECPSCQRHWRAKIVGDDVVPLPLEEEASFITA